MPIAVAGSAATLGPDGKIFVVGGTSGGLATDAVQVYNPIANSWTLSTPLPEALTAAAASVDSLGRLIVMGGMDINGYDVSDVWRSQQFGVSDQRSGVHAVSYHERRLSRCIRLSINATGNPPPTYSLVSGPGGMQVDYYTGAITWTPQGLSQIGTDSVTIQAANYAGVTNWNFTINVPNPPPTPVTNLTVVGVTESSVTLSWSPEDPVVGPVTYSVWLRHVIHSPKGSLATSGIRKSAAPPPRPASPSADWRRACLKAITLSQRAQAARPATRGLVPPRLARRHRPTYG